MKHFRLWLAAALSFALIGGDAAYAQQAVAYNQVSVGTTPTLIVPQRPRRVRVTITTTSATVLYIGGAGVTTSNGLYIAAAAGASVTINGTAAIFGVVGTGTLTVSYLEEF